MMENTAHQSASKIRYAGRMTLVVREDEQPWIDSTLSTQKVILMNWNQVQGNWKQFTGKVKEKWGDITDDDLDRIAGKRDVLVGHIQEKYGIAQEEAEKQVKDWEKTNKLDG